MNPWLIAAALIAWGGSVWYAWESGGDNREGLVRGEIAQRDNAALRKANDEIQALQNEARAEETRKAGDIAAISTKYQRELQNAENRRRADVDAARSGAIVLRDPGATGAPLCGPGEAAQAAAAPGGRDGGAAGELSPEAAAFLLDLANEADELAGQLRAAQDVIRKDRE